MCHTNGHLQAMAWEVCSQDLHRGFDSTTSGFDGLMQLWPSGLSLAMFVACFLAVRDCGVSSLRVVRHGYVQRRRVIISVPQPQLDHPTSWQAMAVRTRPTVLESEPCADSRCLSNEDRKKASASNKRLRASKPEQGGWAGTRAAAQAAAAARCSAISGQR